MQKKMAILLVLGIIALIGGLYYFFIENNREPPSQLVLYGNVDIRQVDLGFRVFGRVQKLYVDEGDSVKPGELLAELDPTPYELEAAQSLAAAKAIQANFENAVFKLERRDEMSEAAVSEEEYDDALFSAINLGDELAQAQAAHDIDLLHINDTKLYAPASGTILTRAQEPGAIMNTSDIILTLSLDAPVWIRAYVRERELGTIYPGMKAYVTTDAYPDEKIEAHIGFISPVAEFTPKSVETTTLRTELVYRLRVIVDNPPKTLRQGMPVTVCLLYDNNS